jgi:hypothetical protein
MTSSGCLTTLARIHAAPAATKEEIRSFAGFCLFRRNSFCLYTKYCLAVQGVEDKTDRSEDEAGNVSVGTVRCAMP